MEFGTLVFRVQDAEYFTLADRGCSLSDENTVHDDFVTRVEIPEGKLVFCRHPRLNLYRLAVDHDFVSGLDQIHEAGLEPRAAGAGDREHAQDAAVLVQNLLVPE